MKTLVIGLGALGTVYSCLLSLAGHEVTGLSRPKSIDKIKTEGVKVTGIWGEHTAILSDVVSNVRELTHQKFDMIIVTVNLLLRKKLPEKLLP